MNLRWTGRLFPTSLALLAGMISSNCNEGPNGSPEQPTSAAVTSCRTFPALYRTTSQSGTSATTSVVTCSFDRSGATVTCSKDGGSWTQAYGSVTDFVDEGTSVGRLLVARIDDESTFDAGARTVYGYDGQRRLTQWVSESWGGKFASRTTFKTTAWDLSGRPIAVDASQEYTGLARPGDYSGPVTCSYRAAYDDTSRTVNRSGCLGIQSASIETYDSSLFLSRSVVTTSTGVMATVTNSIDSMFTVCK